MIRVTHNSGNDYYHVEGLCSYVSTWGTMMDTKGGIRLYDGDISLVVDFRLGDFPDETVMISYPHSNKKETLALAEQYEFEIRDQIIAASKLEPTRKIFTFDLGKLPPLLLKKEHFNRFTSSVAIQDELFTFENPDPKVGWPKLYVHEKGQKASESYGELFRVQVRASRFLFPRAVDNYNPTGSRFLYMMINSYNNFEFKPEVPNLTGVRWPTKLDCTLPANLRLSALNDFLIAVGIDKVVMKNGVIIDDSGEEDIVDIIEQDDDDADIPIFLLPQPNDPNLESQIKRNLVDKGCFSLADGINFGLERLLSLIPISNKVVPAIVDFPGLVYKMCVYNGIFHIIPPSGLESGKLAEILDLSDEMMKICNSSTYPNFS